MRYRTLLFALLVLAPLLSSVISAAAQEAGLKAEITDIFTREDVYGGQQQVVEGRLLNPSADAYTDIVLLAEVYDADDTLIGEGLGYVVNACGAGLLPDFALQPGAARVFDIPLELYEQDAEIDRIEVIPQATATDPTAAQQAQIEGVTRISDAEVVQVEWLDSRALRYGVGCDQSLFTELEWHQYSLRTNTDRRVVHPRADDLTPEFLQNTGLDDPALFENTVIAFPPEGERIVYQGEINRLLTAEADGTFIRNLYDSLYNRTFQGLIWLDGTRFLAYYFGAYGDPVFYFTATEQSQPISLNPLNNMLSDTVPGASPDGRWAIISTTLNDVTGYYLKALTSEREPTLLFEAEPPGNNWPAPIFLTGEDETERVYIARPVDGQAMLQCYSIASAQLTDLTPLPLNLATDERAWMWLSPDQATIALAANGVNGGLWLVDLTALPPCA